MSVINKMLRDLDARRGALPDLGHRPTAMPGVRSIESKAGSSVRRWGLTAALLVVVAGAALALGVWLGQPESDVPVRDPMSVPNASVPVAGLAAPASASVEAPAVSPQSTPATSPKTVATGAAGGMTVSGTADVSSPADSVTVRAPAPAPAPAPVAVTSPPAGPVTPVKRVAPPSPPAQVAAKPAVIAMPVEPPARVALPQQAPAKQSANAGAVVPPAIASGQEQTMAGQVTTQTASSSVPPRPQMSASGTRRPSAARETLAQAQSMWAAGARDAAMELLREAVAVSERAVDPASDPQALALLARELSRMELEQGRPAAVLALLTRLEPRIASQADLWAVRGNAAQRLGRHAESVQAYQRALQLQPGQSRWMLGAAVSLAALGQLDAAAEQAERARAAGPVSAEVLAYLRQVGVPLR